MMSHEDKAVRASESLSLLQSSFAGSGLQTVYEHPKGHALPCRAEDVDAVVRFLTGLPGRELHAQ